MRFIDRIIDKIVAQTAMEVGHYIFSAVGIDALKVIVEKAEKNRELEGNSNYESLAKLMSEDKK